jgi:anaerobic selenocysteine-containing dehydrogenase
MEMIKTDCGICINCCGVNGYVEDGKIVKVEGAPEHWLNHGLLCPKGEHIMEYVYSPNRVKYPLKKVNGRFERISWDQATTEIGAKLMELKAKYGAHTLATFTGSVGVEHFEMAAFNQRFVKGFGSPNFFNAEGICFRTRILARQITFGRYPVENPRYAKCIILWGHNPDASYFPQGIRIREAIKDGAKLVVIDPRRIPLANEGIYYQIRPGTDCAVALAMINVIIEQGLWNKEFVEKWCFGFDKLAEHVKTMTPEWAAAISGIPAAEIRRIARMYASAEASCIVEGVGHLTQYHNGLQTHRVFAILQAITGNVENPGGWVTCPQPRFADLRLPIEEKNLGYNEYPVFHQYGSRPPPYGSASMMAHTMLTGNPYPIKAFISSGANPAVTFPDTKMLLEGFKQLELNVSIDPYLTETGQLADYVLPACTCFEETGIGGFPWAISYGEPYIMKRKALVEPLYESEPIWKIWTLLAAKVGLSQHFPWKSDEEVFAHFFSTSGITMKDFDDHPEGLYFGKKEHKVTGFATKSGKIELFAPRMEELGFPGIPTHIEPAQSHVANPELSKEYPETLLTGCRDIEYIDAQLRDIPALRIARPEGEVMVSPVTAKKYDIIHGEMVSIETPRGSIRMKANVTPDIMAGVISVPHGWPGANSNVLLDSNQVDKVTGYIEMDGLACRLAKIS